MTTTIPTDEIVFSTVPSLTTCSQVTIGWAYHGTTPPTSNYPLVVTNIGIDQGSLSRREYPSVSRRSATVVNMTLSAINPSLDKFDWLKVNIPQGRYRLDVYTTVEVLSSNLFNVTNGVDVSCLVAPSQSSILSSSAPSVTPPFPTHSTSSTNNPSIPVVGNLSVSKGVIAGAIVSGVAVLALIAVIALWALRRRRTIARNATPPGSVPRTKGQASRGLHNPSDSTGTILPFGGGNQENSPQFSTSEEDFASEKSTVAFDDNKLNLTPIVATRSYSKSSTSSRRPVSMTVKPSFESRETVQSRPSRQPRRSLDSSMVPPNKTTLAPSPPSPSHPRYPSDRTRRASRKPVPVYDPSEFPSSESNDIPLSARPETDLSGGAKIYYLIPDAPPGQRK
ncbi:hypothetical protein BDM02DRAFT_3265434 [Thelephora ganbajun]|uniref:Uncharacterized protein n=1 Tax=Thelephora ganbajun TaxID=370292 RepID=A0ACB6ZWA6_THEGA|nr:hypothetical protein BDM02DRAFT_3265434 [Thelephora ganbajun]